MSTDDEEPDPRETPLHPRRQRMLAGHRDAERRLLDAYASGKFHHAWLLTGPKGIGKSTLAYRLAKYLLRYPEPATAPRDSLAVPPDSPVAAQVDARAHPDLLTIQRRWFYDSKKSPKGWRLSMNLDMEAVSSTRSFLSRTAAYGGWRVIVADSMDDLNANSANALLKSLEEPPAKSVFILVCNQRGRLLPTIRSRCIELAMPRLSDDETRAALEALPSEEAAPALKQLAFAQGSPGFALSLAETGAGRIFARFTEAAARGRIDEATRIGVASDLHGRGTDDRFRIFCDLLDGWITGTARAAARNPDAAGQGLELARAHEAIGHSIRQTNALNLDRRLTMVQAFDLIDKARRA